MPKYQTLTEQEWTILTEGLAFLAGRGALCPGQAKINGGQPYEKPKVGFSTEAGSHLGAIGRGAPRGAGLVVMTGCNLRCRGCIYAETAIQEQGTELTVGQLADIFLDFQAEGMKRLVLMNATHQAHHIISALWIAAGQGFSLPVVWYSNGYEYPNVLQLLDRVTDVWAVDFKFADESFAKTYTGANDYVATAKSVLIFLDQLAGPLVLDEERASVSGLVIRHLYLPGQIAQAKAVFKFVRKELGGDTYVELIPCYIPWHQTVGDQTLGRKVTGTDLGPVLRLAQECGLARLEVV